MDNTNTAGIVNNTIKRQRSRAMEMRYFWLLSQEAQKMLAVSQHPGAENMGKFPSKANFAARVWASPSFTLHLHHRM